MTRRLAAAIALILAANALYAPYVNRIMMCDEANTLYQYSQDLARALLSYATPNNHMLHSALVWTITNLAGTSTVAVRFVALASALLTVALMFRVATRMAGLRAGIAAAAFLMTNLIFADFAINARGYSLSVALTLLLIDRLFLTRSVYTRGYRYSLLAISFALILLLPSMLMLIIPAAAWIAWQARSHRRYRSLLPPLLTGVALAAIFYVPSFLQGLFAQHLSEFGESDLIILARLWTEQTFATPGVGLIFAASCLVGLVTLRRLPRARDVLLVVLGGAVVVAVVQLLVLHKLFFARNYLFLIVPVALIAGIGFSRIARQWTTPLIAALLLASILPMQALDGDYIEKRIVNLVEQNVGENDRIISGPCFNAPIQYQLLHNGEGDKLFSMPETDRIFVVIRDRSYQEVLDLYNMRDRVTACQPITDGSWEDFDVYTCQPLNPPLDN